MVAGSAICAFATSETWRDKASGERKERTEWHTVAIFNENLVGVAERFLKKGSKVYIEGSSKPGRPRTIRGRNVISPKWCCAPIAGNSRCLMAARRRGGGGEGEDYAGGGSDFGSSSPMGGGFGGGGGGYGGGGFGGGGGAAGGGRKPAPASRPSDDMDDEIPF